LRADPLASTVDRHSQSDINGVHSINGVNGINGHHGHHLKGKLTPNPLNVWPSGSETAIHRIRNSSSFPHRIRESSIRSILDRVELIDEYDPDHLHSDGERIGSSPLDALDQSPLTRSQHAMIDKLIDEHWQQHPRDAAAFNVVDLGDIIRQHLRWTSLLPQVQPFYAVKCNPDPVIVTLLDALGASFDCASRSEFDLLLSSGVAVDGSVPEKVVFSHPCKHPVHLEYAHELGVNLCTFDNEWEIEKIARFHPQCKALLRIQVDDSCSKMKFNSKYGFNVEDSAAVDRMFEVCRKHGVDLKGIMFHVGSGCMDSSVYGTAIEQSKFLFELAHSKFGYDPERMDTLDLGGGFPGLEEEEAVGCSFEQMAQQINHSLAYHFGAGEGAEGGEGASRYRFIAEPGRYYVAKSHSLVCEVIAKKRRGTRPEDGFMYYLNDGIFGAFNGIVWEKSAPLLLPRSRPTMKGMESMESMESMECIDSMESTKIKTKKMKVDGLNGLNGSDGDDSEALYPSTIFGPTCDSTDTMYEDYRLRELDIMDNVVVPHLGAYSVCLHAGFNGFEKPKSRYVMTV